MQLYNFFPDPDLWVTHTIQHRPIKSDTTIRAYNIRKTEVNGFPAVEYYCEGFLSGDYKMYSVIFGNGKTSLNCGGMIYDMEQYDEYMDEFKKIIKTIRFKEE